MVTTTTGKKIDIDEAEMLIRNKPQFYDALRAIDWHLPTLKSPICTVDFLKKVRSEEIFCLKTPDVRL